MSKGIRAALSRFRLQVSDREDIQQEVFLAYHKLASKPDNAAAWATTVARNKALDLCGQRRRTVPIGEAVELAEDALEQRGKRLRASPADEANAGDFREWSERLLLEGDVRAEVFWAKALGHSDRQIRRDLGFHRRTTRKALDEIGAQASRYVDPEQDATGTLRGMWEPLS